MGMKSVFSVITSLVVFMAGWLLVASATWLLTMLSPLGTFIDKITIWLVGPFAGAYAAIALTSKWFQDVRVETIYVGFLSVFLTLMTVLIGSSLLIGFNSLRLSEWVYMFGALAQVVAAVFGAILAKNETTKSRTQRMHNV